jgi:glycosyltransferase involved in cell wall biosynthesis
LGGPKSWHERRSSGTTILEWFRLFRYVHKAIKSKPDCIITCFPQPALVAAVLLSLEGKSSPPLIAWHFNLGSLSNGWKGYFAGRFLKRVDRFVVHSRSEIEGYAKWLGIEKKKFCFVPLQRATFNDIKPSPIQNPYIVAMGSANRDYTTLINAILGTGIKTVIISKKTILDNLSEHPDLLKLSNLTEHECRNILGGAELNIVPISSPQTASGQVTFLMSMRMGIPTIATRCAGTIDYIQDGETGVLVPLGDPIALQRAIKLLWRDNALRLRIGSAGRDYAEEHFSDEVVGRQLGRVIDDVLE